MYAALKANNECVPVTDKDRVIDFLPFTHIFERGWAYLCLSEGAQLIINTYPQEIQESMRGDAPYLYVQCAPLLGEGVYRRKAKMDEAGPNSRRSSSIMPWPWDKSAISYIANELKAPSS